MPQYRAVSSIREFQWGAPLPSTAAWVSITIAQVASWMKR
jgi:hypothetical protein